MPDLKPVCAILGTGPGNGLACARHFAHGGYATALCARSLDRLEGWADEIEDARAFACDLTDPASIAAAFARIREEMGLLTTLIFNGGASHWGSIDILDDTALEADFTLHALGLFRAAQAALPDMREAGHGTIIVIGAGAALRGRPASISVAAAKAAQRSIAQSLARQLGPENIHVGYIVLDGIVDLDRAKERFPDKPDSFFLTAAGVAEAAWMLSQQDRQAWTFELDLRPFGESW